jgi:hypothetical protein
MGNLNPRRVLVLIGSIVGFGASAASAQLVPAVGPGTGTFGISHFTAANAGNVAGLPLFDNGGVLVRGGNNFPSLGAVNPGGNIVNGGLVANVPVTQNSPGNAPAIAGINSARTTLVGIGGGGRAGLLATDRFLDVGVVPGGGIGVNAFGGTVDYVNAGAGLISSPIVSFTAGTINLGAPGNDFGVIAVRSKIEVGIGVGFNFVPTSTAFLNDIIVRFDGAGGRQDDVLGDFGFFNQPNATTLNFSVASVGGIANVVPGATVRLTTVATIMGDPMSFTSTNLAPEVAAQLPTGDYIGFGTSDDAAIYIPAPGALVLAGLGALVCAGRRRR